MKIQDFLQKKQAKQKITMVTCYDYPKAKIIENTDVDCILVGDSVSMVVHGHTDTTKATMEMMVLHTEAVARGIKTKFIVADMPFLSYRKSQHDTISNAQRLIQAGAHAVKLEGADGNLEIIQHLMQSGVPVMGHLGLTPQSIHTLGGYKVQGREDAQAEQLFNHAKQLEQAGCFAIVFECVPFKLATKITDALQIPTIGIGAGPDTDGQVLVLHDLLGLQQDFNPKFAKAYMRGYENCRAAINDYVSEVKTGKFPELDKHSFK